MVFNPCGEGVLKIKEVKAYITKHKLGSVIRSLHKIKGLTGVTIIECSGYGRGLFISSDPEIDLHPGLKLEIICRDDLMDVVISTIEKAAYTGLKGDGKIYVSSIEQAVRISTGERSEDTV